MKKVLASLLALAMIVPMGVTGFAATKYNKEFTFTETLVNGDGDPAFTDGKDSYKTGDDLFAVIGTEATYGFLTDDDITKVSIDKEEGGKYIGKPELVERKFDGVRMVAVKLPIIEDWTDKEYKVELEVEVTAKKDLFAGLASKDTFPIYTSTAGGATGVGDKAVADFYAEYAIAAAAQTTIRENLADYATARKADNDARDNLKKAYNALKALNVTKVIEGTNEFSVPATYDGATLSDLAKVTAALTHVSINGATAVNISDAPGVQAAFTAYKTAQDAVETAAAGTKQNLTTALTLVGTNTDIDTEAVADRAAADSKLLTDALVGAGTAGYDLLKGDKLIVPVQFWLQNIKEETDDATIAAGQKGMVIKPVKNEENTVEWEDENDVIARLSFTADSSVAIYFPKLSTKWDNIRYAELFNDQDAFVREFVSNPEISSTSRAVLELVVPYVDEDGDLTIAEEEIIVYQQNADGELEDITAKGEFVTNDDDELVFKMKTRQLGTYVFAELPVEETAVDGEEVPAEVVDPANGGKVNPGTGC